MKKAILITTFLLTLVVGFYSKSKAQTGYTYLTMSGYTSKINRAYGGQLGFEFSKKNNLRISLIGNWFRDYKKNYNEYTAGLFLKPMLLKHVNSGIRYVLGVSVGTNDSTFICEPAAGLELFHIFPHLFEIAYSPMGTFSTSKTDGNLRYQNHLSIKFKLN